MIEGERAEGGRGGGGRGAFNIQRPTSNIQLRIIEPKGTKGGEIGAEEGERVESRW
jgi:hypothetical protein